MSKNENNSASTAKQPEIENQERIVSTSIHRVFKERWDLSHHVRKDRKQLACQIYKCLLLMMKFSRTTFFFFSGVNRPSF